MAPSFGVVRSRREGFIEAFPLQVAVLARTEVVGIPSHCHLLGVAEQQEAGADSSSSCNKAQATSTCSATRGPSSYAYRHYQWPLNAVTAADCSARRLASGNSSGAKHRCHSPLCLSWRFHRCSWAASAQVELGSGDALLAKGSR